MRIRRLMLSVSFFWIASTALAAGGRNLGGPCVEDAKKYCAGVSVVGGQLQDCLKKHINELSATCKAQYGGQSDGVKNAAGNVKANCAAEVQKWCKGVSPIGGAMQKCIKDNSKNLSDGCKGSVDSMKSGLIPSL